MVKCCTECGHPIAADSVTRDLPPIEALIFSSVSKAGSDGISIDDLIDKIYSTNPNGGPLYARNVVSVLKHRLNRRLTAHGLCVVSSMGHGSRYKLCKMEEAV